MISQATTTRLTKSQLAQRWQCNERTIDRRRKESGFPKPIQIGHLVRWCIEDVIDWENSQKNK